MRHRIALLFWGPVLLVTLFMSGRSVGPLPALGPFLDPVRGVWSVAAVTLLPDSSRASVTNMTGTTQVIYDDRHVPHIFASSRQDAMRALGYVVARDRLFQLDIQTRATAGTLTGLVGERALSADRSSRRLGLAWAAERDYAGLDPASDTYQLLSAYSDGVNEWINTLAETERPVEYRLLEAEPAEWKPQYSLYLLKRMGWILAYENTERSRNRAAALVGLEAARALFPENSPLQAPIQSTGADSTRLDPLLLPPPGPPSQMAAAMTQTTDIALGQTNGTCTGTTISGPNAPDHQCSVTGCADEFDCSTETVIGSNNWAIGPLKSVSGNAVLAGDPHLDLSLPSIWYEVHLVVPGELDVYGVTIPGTAGIVIGFNRDVAWTFTNTGADVLDFYDEMLDNNDNPTRYMLDGAWRQLEARVEAYHDERGRQLAIDTIYHTHRGPVLRTQDRNLSLRWTVLEAGGEQEAFNRVATARNVDDWLEGMESFVAPAQNGLVADRFGSIAIRSHGHFPLRPDSVSGAEFIDGTTTATDWIGYWPTTQYPYSIDPARAFLASANQQPIDPRVGTPYLGANWPSPWRAMRINEILGRDSTFTSDDMRQMQTDAGSARADYFVPYFLNAGERVLALTPDDTTLGQALRLLGDWNRQYDPDNDRAILFEMAMDGLTDLTWDELELDDNRVVTPGSGILAGLLADSANVWWDDASTGERETRDSILVKSLRSAFVQTRTLYGSEDDGGWVWSEIRNANIYHLLQLPGFSALDIPVRGGPSTLSPLSGSGEHGASWRMVVELGDTIGAWVTYPGGQSGNPASPYYANRIDEWATGQLSIPLVPEAIDRLPEDRILSRLTLTSAN